MPAEAEQRIYGKKELQDFVGSQETRLKVITNFTGLALTSD
jgi:hypothetical protein